MNKSTATFFLLAGAAFFVAGCLAGCSTELAAGVGTAGTTVARHGAEIVAEATSPIESGIGFALQAIGAIAVAVGGIGHVAGKRAATVTNEKIAKFDAAPETAHFAADGSVIDTAPKV